MRSLFRINVYTNDVKQESNVIYSFRAKVNFKFHKLFTYNVRLWISEL